MKISKTIFAIAVASTFLVTSCRDTKNQGADDHGHEHNPDGSHMEEETMEQEEFQVGKDTMEKKTETHKHDDGSEHHDH
tara:strand:- start:26 stop:262 length:237 start_codon:yes stop_codon:yes gene_type:complete